LIASFTRSEFKQICSALCVDEKYEEAIRNGSGFISETDVWTKCYELHSMDFQLTETLKLLSGANVELVKAQVLIAKAKGIREEKKKQEASKKKE
jgi:hypothetical protein